MNNPDSSNTKKPRKTGRVNNGISTNDLIHSAYQDNNDAVFPLILQLYVRPPSRIADVTFGKGIFWKNVDTSQYEFYPSDLKKVHVPAGCTGGIDSRKLPYDECYFDAIVFDPPYMHTPGGTAHNGHQNYEAYYANNAEQDERVVIRSWYELDGKPPKYHEAVLDLYYRSGREAHRVLKPGGIFIVKCQDEVCTNRQRLTHVEITVEYEQYGFAVEDLFVVMRTSKPGVSRMLHRQYHARKNHSYFMVYRKVGGMRPRPASEMTRQEKDAQMALLLKERAGLLSQVAIGTIIIEFPPHGACQASRIMMSAS